MPLLYYCQSPVKFSSFLRTYSLCLGSFLRKQRKGQLLKFLLLLFALPSCFPDSHLSSSTNVKNY